MADTFHQKAVKIIKKIPRGKVATYGQIALLAGNPRASRMVVRVLYSVKEENLPWHRLINREGKISLREGQGYEEQESLLKSEGVVFNSDGSIDLKKYQWSPRIKL